MTGDYAACPAACGAGGNGGAPSPIPPGPDPAPDPNPPPGAGGSGGSMPDPPPPSGGASACTYPAGPYGKAVGSTLDPSLSWTGFRENESASSTISIQDYFDCDGTKGTNALLLSEGAVWCGACQEEASELNSRMAGGWSQKKIRVLSLIIETGSGNPATIQTAQSWKETFNAQGWAVAADPDFTFSTGFGDALPTSLVVDPRTMKIVDRQEGFDPNNPTLDQVANSNAK
jgi:hypothetical protein